MNGLTEVFLRIWNLALSYQDKRSDEGHAEYATMYALELLRRIPEANPQVVVPAIILHDTGYSQMSEERRMVSYIATGTPEEYAVRLEHQVYALDIALMILEQIGYPSEHNGRILAIIAQHDTRKGALWFIEDSVVRDADKLWRYSKRAMAVNIQNKGLRTIPQKMAYFEKLRDKIEQPGFFFTEEARVIARRDLKRCARLYGIEP